MIVNKAKSFWWKKWKRNINFDQKLSENAKYFDEWFLYENSIAFQSIIDGFFHKILLMFSSNDLESAKLWFWGSPWITMQLRILKSLKMAFLTFFGQVVLILGREFNKNVPKRVFHFLNSGSLHRPRMVTYGEKSPIRSWPKGGFWEFLEDHGP